MPPHEVCRPLSVFSFQEVTCSPAEQDSGTFPANHVPSHGQKAQPKMTFFASMETKKIVFDPETTVYHR